jgi:hypothetical protein
MIKIKDGTENTNVAKLTEEGYFLVDQLEIWIDTLVQMNDGIFQDSKTGNAFKIRRINLEE